MEFAQVIPDRAGANGASPHSSATEALVNDLRDIQEVIQTLGEQGKLGDGDVVRYSDMLARGFRSCEQLEAEACNTGAFGVGFSVLTEHPHLAYYAGISDALLDPKFAISLVSVKVEQLRILRNDTVSGPELNAEEVQKLHLWARHLATSVLNNWWLYFSLIKYRWPPKHPELPRAAEDEDPPQVPVKFQTLVVNFIRMRLDLWPLIATFLDRFRVKGENIFPEDVWYDDYMQEIMAEDPRIVPFVAGAAHIDLNDLARRGPIRRSDSARCGAMDALRPAQRQLLHHGVDFLHRVHKGPFRAQLPKQPWRAMNYKWPRDTSLTTENLLGSPYFY